MKIAKFILPLIVLASVSRAATVDAINLASGVAGSRILVDSLNNTVTSGFGAIGYFSTLSTTLDFQGATGGDLQTDFNILGGPTASFVDSSFGPAIPGIFSISGSGATVTAGTGNNFIGKQAFVVIGNGSSLANSTEAFIFATGVNFSADPSTPVSIDLSGDPFRTDGSPSTGSILFGTGDGVGEVFLGAASFGTINNALKMSVLVPEPSSLLLGALGVPAMLRRKR